MVSEIGTESGEPAKEKCKMYINKRKRHLFRVIVTIFLRDQKIVFDDIAYYNDVVDFIRDALETAFPETIDAYKVKVYRSFDEEERDWSYHFGRGYYIHEDDITDEYSSKDIELDELSNIRECIHHSKPIIRTEPDPAVMCEEYEKHMKELREKKGGVQC